MTTLFLCGDVMTGRGIDQILTHPSDPLIFEACTRDAREYVRIAEALNGPIPRHVDARYVWGEALDELDLLRPDARIINLETSVTSSDEYWRGKGINYRMHPANLPVLAALEPHVCVLANNHVLDYGYSGLEETLKTLHEAGLNTAGAGSSQAEASRPAAVDLQHGQSVVVFAFGTSTSGIPAAWAATETRPGVNYLADLSEATTATVCDRIQRARAPGRILVVSIHWGDNWGYDISRDQVEFAHRVIEAGTDVVHGHSSHHVRPIEVYRNRLILYGCGDVLTDYEGIGQRPGFRDDLVLMYVARLDDAGGGLSSLVMVPLRLKQFRLKAPSPADALWLRETLDSISTPFRTRVVPGDRGHFVLEWT